MADKNFTPAELYEAWPVLSMEERVEGFEFLQREEADDFFLQLSARDRAQLVLALPPGRAAACGSDCWRRTMPLI